MNELGQDAHMGYGGCFVTDEGEYIAEQMGRNELVLESSSGEEEDDVEMYSQYLL